MNRFAITLASATALIATIAQYGVLAAATAATPAAHTSKAPWSMGPLQAKVGWPSKTPVGPVWLNENQREASCSILDSNELFCLSPGTGWRGKKVITLGSASQLKPFRSTLAIALSANKTETDSQVRRRVTRALTRSAT